MRSLLTLFAFSLMLVSCHEEVIFSPGAPQIDSSGHQIPDPAGNFKYYSDAYSVNQGYLVSEAIIADDDLYFHHLVLTEKDLLSNNDLKGISQSIAFNFVTKGKDIAGEHRLSSSSAAEEIIPGMMAYGGQKKFDFSHDSDLANDRTTSGKLTIIKTGDGYMVEADFATAGSVTGLTGNFEGMITEVAPTPREPVSESLFQGPNEFTYYDRTHALNHAYLVKQSPRSGVPAYLLYVTTNDVLNGGSQFTGTSDLMMLGIHSMSPDLSGVFSPSAQSTYADRLNPKLTSNSYYCKNMNFTTYSADDDDPVESITVTVVREGDDVKLNFVALDASGQKVAAGIYRGPLTVVD